VSHKSFISTMSYEEIYNNRYDLDKISYEMPLLGINYYLKADFDYLENVDFDKYNNILVLEENDFILKNRTDLPCKLFSNGIEIEDGRWQGGYDNKKQPILDFEIPISYTKFLNNFIISNISDRNISFWYRYYIPYYEKFIQKKEKICFIQKRSGNISEIKQLLAARGFDTLEEKYSNVSYFDYYSNFGKTKYVINLDSNNSAGQVIAESVLMECIVFAKSHKLFSRLLLPEFCIVRSIEEAIEKIDLLEKRQDLLEQILEEIKRSKIKLCSSYKQQEI
jgi:hypothetical protein